MVLQTVAFAIYFYKMDVDELQSPVEIRVANVFEQWQCRYPQVYPFLKCGRANK